MKRLPFRRSFSIFVLVASAWILYQNRDIVRDGLHTVKDAYWPYVGVAIVAWLLTYIGAALVYTSLASDLPFRRTLLITYSNGFSNRLLPAGLGALAFTARYLTKQGYNQVAAAGLVATNNILGFVGNMILLIISSVVWPPRWGGTSAGADSQTLAWLVLVGLIVLAVLARTVGGKLIRRFAKRLSQTLINSKQLLLALAASGAITVLFATTLYFAARAANVNLLPSEVLLVLSAGVGATALVPTPGGLGGAEAGLIAALVLLGVPTQQAAAVAALYRLITFVLPIIPGFICLQVARSRQYL